MTNDWIVDGSLLIKNNICFQTKIPVKGLICHLFRVVWSCRWVLVLQTQLHVSYEMFFFWRSHRPALVSSQLSDIYQMIIKIEHWPLPGEPTCQTCTTGSSACCWGRWCSPRCPPRSSRASRCRAWRRPCRSSTPRPRSVGGWRSGRGRCCTGSSGAAGK